MSEMTSALAQVDGDEVPSLKEFRAVANKYAALGHPTRLRLLWLICRAERQRPRAELATVTTLAEATGLKPPTVSAHVAQLVAAGYVVAEREGKHTRFSTDLDICQQLDLDIEDVRRPLAMALNSERGHK
jgi:DNA-binding transcriptional ArsR family regulator